MLVRQEQIKYLTTEREKQQKKGQEDFRIRCCSVGHVIFVVEEVHSRLYFRDHGYVRLCRRVTGWHKREINVSAEMTPFAESLAFSPPPPPSFWGIILAAPHDQKLCQIVQNV